MLFHIAVGLRPSPMRKIAYRSDQCKGARGDDAAPLEARLLAGVAEARHKHAVAHHVVGDVKRGDGVWRAVIPPRLSASCRRPWSTRRTLFRPQGYPSCRHETKRRRPALATTRASQLNASSRCYRVCRGTRRVIPYSMRLALLGTS